MRYQTGPPSYKHRLNGEFEYILLNYSRRLYVGEPHLISLLQVAFLAVAVFGIILKCSKTVVQNLLEKIFEQYNIGDENMRQMVKFITDNAGELFSILLIFCFN